MKEATPSAGDGVSATRSPRWATAARVGAVVGMVVCVILIVATWLGRGLAVWGIDDDTLERHLDAMPDDESCSCNTCQSIGSLDLKIVVHHGRFLRQLVGGRGQVAGADVILAHQLLKNDLGKRAYLLLTEAALRWFGLDAMRSDLAVHVARYAYLGDVRCFVRELADPAPLTAPAAA